jgi:fibronectin type III domain protein
VRVRLPYDAGDWYNVYGSPAAGQPIAYGGSPLNQTQTTSDTIVLPAAAGAWGFGVRAANRYGEEQNVDCAITIVLDRLGNDITNRPLPPVGLRAFATPAAGVRVEWHYPPTRGAKAPTGFRIYIGIGGIPDYSAPVATVPFDAVILNSCSVELSGLADGATYVIGVRAYNAAGEEANTSTVRVTADARGPIAVAGLSATAIV